ncbi:putative NreB protein [Devosia sp. LC5]|uniref:MFS transporter n=1 Tax=Devosia sp. LC5 TaxID=1502724 RepID=UPI0004E3670C|nr:MFS transporter [Devosia sp. LC5]KFC72528.1 putative NreB protein [Devosia sp. LC5]
MPDGKPAGYGSLLALPAPRRLALASVPADFADWLDYAAVVALLVFAWGEGPFVMALFALALTLPYVTAGPLLSMIVDRSPLGRVLFLSNLGRGLATFALLFAPNTAMVLIVVFLRGCVDSAFNPARQAAIQATTPPDLLAAANGLHQAINQTSKIAGPALGGLLLAFMPAQGVFGVNAVLSLLAAAIVLSVSLPARAPTGPSADFRTEFLAGAAEFRRSRLLLAALVFSAIAYFAFFLYDTLIALLADEFGYGAAAFGFSIAASGAGGLLGAVLAGRLTARNPVGGMIMGAVVAGAIASVIAVTAILGFKPPVLLFFIAMAIAAGSTTFMLVPYRTIVQAEAPPDRIARVFAAGEAVTMAVMLSAPFIGSIIATAYGTGMAFLAGGVLLLVLALAALIVQRAGAIR